MSGLAVGDFARVRGSGGDVRIPVGVVMDVVVGPIASRRWPGQGRPFTSALIGQIGPRRDARQWIDVSRLEPVPTLDDLTAERRAWLDWYVPHLMRHVGLCAYATAERVGLLADAVIAIERAAPAGAGRP